jgi:hypothetical protein
MAGDLLLSTLNDTLLVNDGDANGFGINLLGTQGGVIDVNSIDGSILMPDASLVDSGRQAVRFSAEADIQLDGIDAGVGGSLDQDRRRR